MILYFADRHLNILGQASTRLPGGGTVVNDRKTDDIETGVSIFECDILFDRKTRLNVEAWTEVGNYVLRSANGENEFYNIIDAEIDTKKQKVRIYAEDEGLDLINEIADPYKADQYYPIATYIERFAAGSGWEIGINEIEGLTRKLNLDGDKTVSAMLLDIAEGFNNAEISYSFEIDGLQVIKKYINIYEKRGKDTGIQLRLNKEIDSIITTKTITNLATALKCKGATPDNSEEPITFKDFDYFDYDDGDFYIDGAVLKSRKALEKWSRFFYKGQSGGHIVKPFSFDTTSPEILCEKAIEELKKICDTEINYEVDFAKFPDNVKVGDRVNIIDDDGNLYLSSRILTLETSDCDETHSAILGENLIRDSGISQTVAELAQQFSELANKRNFFTWVAYADDIYGNGISTNPEGKDYLGIATNKKVNVVDISDPSVFTWSKIKGEPGTPGEPGTNANSIIKLYPEYCRHDSASTPPEENNNGWSVALPEWVSGKYIWERQRVEWSDGSFSYSDPVLCSALNHANEAAEYATEQAEIASEKAAQAEAHASNANEAAAEAQEQAAQSTAAFNKANEDIQEIKGDIQTAEEEIAEVVNGIETIRNTLTTDYSKKTELTEIETSLKSEISRNSAEILSTVSQTYSLKTDTEEAQRNAAEAKTAAESAQNSANTAIADAEAAMNAANVADKAAKDAQAVASAAENDLEEAKANLEAITGRVDATEEDISAAQTAVQQAQTKADEAKSDAENAITAANEAYTNANNAKTAADDAQTKAEQALADLEDIQDRVSANETKITQNSEKIELSASSIEETSGRVTIAESLLKQLSDSIQMLVTDESGTSLMTQTADGWTFSTKAIQDTVNSISTDLNTLAENQGSTDAVVSVLEQAINDIEAKAGYVRIGEFENEPCVELGKPENDYSIMITNTRVLFRVGSNTPTLINADGLVTQNIEVENEIRQGSFIQIAYNGWGLLWKGSKS